jgi:hypothetical protein
MKLIDATHAARALAILGCLFLLPSCKIINSLVKLPVKIVKTAARTVGVSNLTDQAAQPIRSEGRSEARSEGRSEARDEQGLDTAGQVSE